MVSSVKTSGATEATGTGAFLGFFNGGDYLPDWRAEAEELVIDLTTNTYTSVAGEFGRRDNTSHSIFNHGPSTLVSLGPGDDAKSNLFWMMVRPAPDSVTGFSVTGTWPTSALHPKPGVHFDSRLAGSPINVVPEPADTVNDAQYQDDHPAFEWMPAGTNGVLVVRGDFLLSFFQNGFEVTDGAATHEYWTGDTDPGVLAGGPTYSYTQSRADLTFHNGTLKLFPNGRALQLDLFDCALVSNGAVDLANAKGAFNSGAASDPVAGQVHMDAEALGLTLWPHGTQFDVAVAGTVRSIQIDGQPVELAPATSTVAPSAELPSSIVAAMTVATMAVLAGALLAVRSRTATSLLMAQAQAFFEVGRPKKALHVCRRILRRETGHVDATALATMCLIALKRPAEAKPLLEDSRSTGGEDDGLLAMSESLVLYHTGQMRAALDRLETAFLAHPALHNELAAVDLRDQLRANLALAVAR